MAAPQAPYIGKQGKLTLDEAVFGERFHGPLVHEAVRAELAARRRGTASTKTRAEVAMTGAKAWRQKGTGRARVGALSTPNRTGGGVAFGPKPRAFTVKVNRKARRRALRAALALHAERGSIAATFAGTPSLRRLKSIFRYLRLAPPPRWREVTRPWALRPPDFLSPSVSDLSGSLFVTASCWSQVANRRPGLVGLCFLMAIRLRSPDPRTARSCPPRGGSRRPSSSAAGCRS